MTLHPFVRPKTGIGLNAAIARPKLRADPRKTLLIRRFQLRFLVPMIAPARSTGERLCGLLLVASRVIRILPPQHRPENQC